MAEPTLTQAKAALRARLLAARAARDPEAIQRAGAAVARHGLTICVGAGRVAAYAALPGEPPTEPLVTALRRAGIDVLLPVITGNRLDWALDAGAREAGPLGIAQPKGIRLGADALGAAEVVFVPALAVDPRGVRLGRGGGFYDRALAQLPSTTLTVAVVYDDERLPTDLPAEAHDVPVAAVLSPTGVSRLGGQPAADQPFR